MKYYSNKFVYILIFFTISFFIYSYNCSKSIILHKNHELRNIEIFVNSNNDYLKLLNDKLNQYDDLIWYSYIDNSNDIKFYNSLKKKSIDQLLLYEYLLREPTIESILTKFLEVRANHPNFIEYKKIFIRFIDELYSYVNIMSLDENVGNKIFNNLIDEGITYENSFHKIIIKSNKNFNNLFEINDDYEKLYKFLNYVDNKNFQIISVKFYDRFLYNKYIDVQNDNIKVLLDECILCYSKSIDELKVSLSKLNALKINYISNSILDFIITDDIRGDKYKMINKILINANNYKDIDAYDPNFNVFIELLKDVENIIFNLEKFNDGFDDSIYKIKVIIDFFQNNKDNYKYYYNLIDSYNRSIYQNIRYIANTEKFSEDKLSLFIYNDYYRNGNYVSRFFIDNNDIDILESAFNLNTSNQWSLK